MKRCHVHSGGFSLPELLIVIGIIVTLIAILLPAVMVVRQMARATVCLSNLRQWGQAYQMYITSNHVKTLPEQQSYGTRWFEALSLYNGNVSGTLLCPEAAEPREPPAVSGSRTFGHSGTATSPWRQVTYEVREPQWILRGDYFGSYGFNACVYKHAYSNLFDLYIHFPVKEPERIPFLGDCTAPWVFATTTDPVPTNLYNPGDNGLWEYCIDRHRMAVNIEFLDGHAEREILADLWLLQWSEASKPVNVQVAGQ